MPLEAFSLSSKDGMVKVARSDKYAHIQVLNVNQLTEMARLTLEQMDDIAYAWAKATYAGANCARRR